MSDLKAEFNENCQAFYNLIKDKEIKNLSRGQQNLPKLNYAVRGNYVYIENHQAFLNYCNRKLVHLTKYFTQKLGCAIEHTSNYLRIRGNLKLDLIKHAEKQFYLKEVLCTFCNSPETERTQNEISCFNCHQNRIS